MSPRRTSRTHARWSLTARLHGREGRRPTCADAGWADFEALRDFGDQLAALEARFAEEEARVREAEPVSEGYAGRGGDER